MLAVLITPHLSRRGIYASLVARRLVIEALNAIKEKRFMIPGDIALIGWDDFDAAPHLQTPLTVVEQPTQAMGSIAAEQLMKMRFNEAVDPSLHIVLKSTLIIRESSEKQISKKS